MGNSASGIAPDFRAGTGIMRRRIVGVGKLVEQDAATFGLHPLGEITRQFHATFLGRQHQFGPVGTHALPPLDALVLGHHQNEAIAHDGTGHGERDSGIPRGRFDQGIAGTDATPCRGSLDHGQRRPVLDRTRRVVAFKLEQHTITARFAGGTGQTL